MKHAQTLGEIKKMADGGAKHMQVKEEKDMEKAAASREPRGG